jgi:hypothetical protein
MTAALATTPPTSATAGDTWTWTDTHSLYPAGDGWVLAYRITGPDVLAWSSGWLTVSGNTSTIVIPAASTVRLRAGRYVVHAEYTLSGERHTEACDPLIVAANPATQSAGAYKTQEECELEQVNDAISAMLAGKAVQYYQIGNRQVGNTPLKDLYAIRDALQTKIAAQTQSSSSGFGRAIKSRFVPTSA